MNFLNTSAVNEGEIVIQNQNAQIKIESNGKFQVNGKTIKEDLELYEAFRDFFGLDSHKKSVENLINNPEGAIK